MDNSSISLSTCHQRRLDNLPDLVYYYILKHLDLDDIWSLRLINKRFYFIIKDHNIKELTFVCDRAELLKLEDLAKPFTNRNVLLSYRLSLIVNPSDNLIGLRDLTIRFTLPDSFRLKDLNKFDKLKHLDIDHIFLSPDDDDLLQLPNLKELNIKFYTHSHEGMATGNVLIDTPNLQTLVLYKERPYYRLENRIKLKHPLSIRRLRIGELYYDASVYANLECLTFYIWNEAEGLRLLNDIPKLKRLKKLKIEYVNCVLQSSMNKLKSLFKSKDGFEIVLHGVNMKSIDKFSEYEGGDHLQFQLNNYSQLEDDLRFIKSMNYDELMCTLSTNQPTDLSRKYTNIQKMEIKSRIDDANRLIHFISGCKFLNKLRIIQSSLRQRFYDQLATISSLIWLEIYEREDMNLNFEFIMKMPHLNMLSTDQDLGINRKLNLNELQFLEYLRFEYKFREYKLYKYDKDIYRIHEPIDGQFSFDKLVKHFSSLRDENPKKRKFSE